MTGSAPDLAADIEVAEVEQAGGPPAPATSQPGPDGPESDGPESVRPDRDHSPASAVASSRQRIADLEQEGEIAADYLEALLDIVDMDGDLDLDVEGERAVVAVVGDGLDLLVGARGETLEALQELTRLAVLQKTGVRSRLMLDVGGHRARRRAELRDLAAAVAERVKSAARPEKLKPMTPFERKVVHDLIATIDGVVSESEGEEPQRRVVVLPAS
ncbi:protein jag [Protofrankia symbiont of Coriaria ruscifolia]|uniref:Single-stranded nucleic acid binding protein n=1 Tax=Candidatus Protofrankia californiensis TaxID=1839754 RepID=A0A1C3PH68_9ACTN|nr:R3H domain-containing nucleic acid-binding protein [Protofrankia symbiont of Coriaria ruscifolia]SBW29181.1 single-stranded nucleic acid binding protein [Candidatus Protofrankia californiensis]